MEVTMIYKAIKFAEAKHDGQVRKGSNLPYVTHPINVSYLLAKFKQSKNLEELMVAAILHDTIEDTNTTFIEIATEFSPLVASLVLELTSDEKEIKRVGKREYLKKKMIGISNYGLVLKLVDRLSNIMDKPWKKYIEETEEIMAYISEKRTLTKTQTAIVAEILSVTKKWKEDHEIFSGVK